MTKISEIKATDSCESIYGTINRASKNWDAVAERVKDFVDSSLIGGIYLYYNNGGKLDTLKKMLDKDSVDPTVMDSIMYKILVMLAKWIEDGEHVDMKV